MPFIRVDDDGYEIADGDDDADVTHTGSFDYAPPEEVAYKPRPFDPANLSAWAAAALSVLRDLGIVRFRVRYDGGHDEGFAHADAGWSADGVGRPIGRIVADVTATAAHVDALRAAFGVGSPASPAGPTHYYANLSPDELVAAALDELGNEMVSCLLGDGYGTGEYSMYGELTADLTTGTLTDEPAAPRPPDVTFD